MPPPTPTAPPARDFLSEIRWRGLLHQATDEPALRAHLDDPARGPGGRLAYVGFDPTADSLTIGNLVPIMLLRHFQRAGHTPVVIAGGGTGLIGDPSGKSSERQLLTGEQVQHNVDRQRRIFDGLLSEDGPNAMRLVNNADWLAGLGYIEVLRDVGKHFSVNQMIQRDSVRARLEEREHGISYTEFSYMILQAYDFLHLHRAMGVTLQMGGSDQWGNILSGADLIRRASAEDNPGEHDDQPTAFGLTAPLVTKADGGKFGKTESGAVWLTAERTSPYAYYQFWLNASDADVPRFLRLFTLLERDEIERLERTIEENPAAREAQRTLAREATALLHGEGERDRAEHAAQALFSGDLASLDEGMLAEVLGAAPSSTHPSAELAGAGTPLVDVLAATTLAGSKGEARKLLQQRSIAVNGRKVEDPEARVTTSDLLPGGVIALRRGKKTWHVTRWG